LRRGQTYHTQSRRIACLQPDFAVEVRVETALDDIGEIDRTATDR
jgi:hypothetical protein